MTAPPPTVAPRLAYAPMPYGTRAVSPYTTVTASAVQALCAGEKPLAHFSAAGWFHGLTQGLGLRNAFLRAEQFRRAADPIFCRAVACRVVASKIRNQRTLLQRNHIEPPRRELAELKRLVGRAEAAETLDELLGIEGLAARVYFGLFAGMLKRDGEWDEDGALGFDFTKRFPRSSDRGPIEAWRWRCMVSS